MIIATLVLKVKYFQQILVLLNLPNYYHLSGFAFVQNKIACSFMRCSKSYIGLGCDTRLGNPFRNPQLAWPVPIIPLDYVKDVAWSCHIWFIFAKIHFFSPQTDFYFDKSLTYFTCYTRKSVAKFLSFRQQTVDIRRPCKYSHFILRNKKRHPPKPSMPKWMPLTYFYII